MRSWDEKVNGNSKEKTAGKQHGFEDESDPLYHSLGGETRSNTRPEPEDEIDIPSFLRNRDY